MKVSMKMTLATRQTVPNCRAAARRTLRLQEAVLLHVPRSPATSRQAKAGKPGAPGPGFSLPGRTNSSFGTTRAYHLKTQGP